VSKLYENIIQDLKKGTKLAQETLYKSYAAEFLSLTRRYVKNTADAEDVFIKAFYKILTKIDSYTGSGNFEGWMKRIVINESLMHLRKNHNFLLTLEASHIDIKQEVHYGSDIDYQNLLKMLDLLPTGYRTVFNLYVVEGYKHREIAEQLGISINTSKSQLILAKKRMREILKKKHIYNIA
jgi:RNA polymerase sigma-70 factor (ECF subfamily)